MNVGKLLLLVVVMVVKFEIVVYFFMIFMFNLGCLEGDFMKNDGGFLSGVIMVDFFGFIKDVYFGKVIYVFYIFIWFF